jgi:CheY-like chemotaxis protein
MEGGMKDGKYLILCVDDDQDVLDYLKLTLEPRGYCVVTAASAEDGLKRYKELVPDLIIVDLMMEEVDTGTAFCKELRALGNKAPIYMLSSMGDSLNLTTDTSELGLTGVFQKPLNQTMLLRVLEDKLKK